MYQMQHSLAIHNVVERQTVVAHCLNNS